MAVLRGDDAEALLGTRACRVTRRVKLGALLPGDVVVSGLSPGSDGQCSGKGTVTRVDAARAKGYVVVTFADRTQTSQHQAHVVEVEG